MTALPACRLCGATLAQTLVDLGAMPLANRLLTREELSRPEPRYPLHARVCGACFLVQVDNVASSQDIFGDYTYFSSYSAKLGRPCPRLRHHGARPLQARRAIARHRDRQQ